VRDKVGHVVAARDGQAQSAGAVRNYLARALGERLGEAREAMRRLAASLPPYALNRVGFRLYERFRPAVPDGAAGARRPSCVSRRSSGRRTTADGAHGVRGCLPHKVMRRRRFPAMNTDQSTQEGRRGQVVRPAHSSGWRQKDGETPVVGSSYVLISGSVG
jgi:hypothetical protein